MPAIAVSDLTKRFTRTRRAPGLRASLRALVRPERETMQAVSGVSFTVARGEKVAFIGPNGAGKSTTIKMLTGILHPTSGDARVLGHVPWAERRALVARLGCVFGQRSQLWYHLPVAETFRLLERVYGLDARDARRRRDELVALFEIGDLLPQQVRKLSLGQRMRCEIAVSLLHRPEIVMLDEPTIGLDVVARARIRDLLVRLNEHEGITVFLTSHDAGDIEHVCDRVLLIDTGRVVLDTTVESLRRDHLREKRVTAVIEESAVTLDLPGVTSQTCGPHEVVLSVDTRVTTVGSVVRSLVANATVHDVTVSAPSLERVIAMLYARERS